MFLLNSLNAQGEYSHFFFIRRLGPSIFRSPPKKYQEFQAPQKKTFEVLATQKDIPQCVP